MQNDEGELKYIPNLCRWDVLLFASKKLKFAQIVPYLGCCIFTLADIQNQQNSSCFIFV